MYAAQGQLVEDYEFFAPVSNDLIDGLIGQYESTRRRLMAMSEAVSSERCSGVLHYFINANVSEQRYTLPNTVGELFNLGPAVAHLDADFWDRALRMTDVLDYMPQKRRDDWFNQIKSPLGVKAKSSRRFGWSEEDAPKEEWEVPPIPPFEESTVRETLMSLLAMRSQFFGERVDGIFRSLSRDHVTNCPQGFRMRMILNRALNYYGHTEHSTAGVINDLRCVIAKFMGRDEPVWRDTDLLFDAIKSGENGKWHSIDGGAMRIRLYKGVGTAHLEVHPDMAWRLNSVLASIHPMAIPAEFRERPQRKKKVKEFEMINRPLPFAVTRMLASMKPALKQREELGRGGERQYEKIPNTLQFEYGEKEPSVAAEVARILDGVGGVRIKGKGGEYWAFDFEVRQIVKEIVCSGVIPDQKSHQFYPTPESVAIEAMELAYKGCAPGMKWLEPSAGVGNLADLMPKGATYCVEISRLHASILRAKGHEVVEGDFLSVPVQKFDRVVMNPPFSEGRWQAHLEHAARMVAVGGRMVAILPASARGRDVLKGFSVTWSELFSNEFEGTSVSVVIGCFDLTA